MQRTRLLYSPQINKNLDKLESFFEGKPTFDAEVFYDDLFNALSNYAFQQDVRDQDPTTGVKRPRRKQIKKYLQGTMKSLTSKLRWIRKNYPMTGEITDPETGEIIQSTFTRPHDVLKDVYDNLRAAQYSTAKALVILTSEMTYGEETKAFRELIRDLASVYQAYSGTEPATEPMIFSDEKIDWVPTEFQRFVKECFIAFDWEIIETFEDKVHRAFVDRNPSL